MTTDEREVRAISARIPSDLLDAVDGLAKLAHRSRNDVLVEALEETVAREAARRREFSEMLAETTARNERVLRLLAE